MRLRRLRVLFAQGRVPPLELYQIGDDFFVLDGHHRVAIAREVGQEYLDAHVIEYRPDPTDPSNIIYYERQTFARATGLREVYVTELGRYPRLLSRIQSYHRELVQRTCPGCEEPEPRLLPIAALVPCPVPDLREAAREWFESEYQPVVALLRAEGVVEAYPGRALGDLYGYVCDHRWYLSERRGWDVGLDVAVMDFVERFGPKSTADRLVDPIIALGSDIVARVIPRQRGPRQRLGASTVVALAVGIAALPIAFLRGLRPKDDPFHRRTLLT